MIKSKEVEKKLKEAAKRLNCEPGDIWEELIAGYVDNIPSEKEMIEDINSYIEEREK